MRNPLISTESLGRDNLLAFARATFPGYRTPSHLAKLACHLKAVADGEITRLLVLMPPRHGKSELCSIRFPAWYLGRNPDHRVILAAYGADLAERFSRAIRRVIETDEYRWIFPSVRLAQDSRAVNAWDIAGRRGGLKAVGVGGPITGHGANLLIIEDPIKNREEANSQTHREKVWEWYTSTAYTRLEDGGKLVVVMTRWHEDDLAGRLLEAQEAGGDKWHVLHMPAIDAAGNALWPEKYPIGVLEQIRSTIGEYDWASLYQGTPVPREGAMFKPEAMPIVEAVPANLPHVRSWDVAATPGSGDYTVGARMAGPDAEGRFYIVDIVRGQWDTDRRNRIIRQTAELDGIEVKITVPQDPGSAGLDAARAFVRLLNGYRVEVVAVSGDKVLRADPLSAQVNAGNVAMLRAAWNGALVDELRAFPAGAHDDQVDALGDAYRWLTRKRIVRAY